MAQYVFQFMNESNIIKEIFRLFEELFAERRYSASVFLIKPPTPSKIYLSPGKLKQAKIWRIS